MFFYDRVLQGVSCPDPVWQGPAGSPSLAGSSRALPWTHGTSALLCPALRRIPLSCPHPAPGWCWDEEQSPPVSRASCRRCPLQAWQLLSHWPLQGAGVGLGAAGLALPAAPGAAHRKPGPAATCGSARERLQRSQRHWRRMCLRRCPRRRWADRTQLFPPRCSSTSPPRQRRSGYFYFHTKVILFTSGLSRGVWASFKFTFWVACLFSKPAPVLGE